ncbi:MAG: hypothetical protein M3Y87_00980 [Myxococcota bacterium]|nr:hypothetical protein [Myxococcota bacterium]
MRDLTMCGTWRIGRSVLGLLIASAVLGACADGGTERCRVGAECPSGVCLSDGRCAPADGSDAGIDPLLDAQVAIDASAIGPDATIDAEAPDGGARLCSANGDGTIERGEMPLRAGLHATFRVAEGAVISTAGAAQADGTRRWDLSGALDGDADVRRDLRAIGSEWYATEFPGAGWTSRLSQREELLGVFEITEDELLLRGVVSPEDGFSRTLLTYEPAVVVLRFPLREGESWTTTSTVSGQALGVASYFTETYASEVDARGELTTPFGTFEVLRVRTVLDRLVGAFPTRVRTYAFASECFGTVATIASNDNEMQVEFTSAAEVSRLAP